MAKSWVSRSIEALSELVWRPPCALCDRPSQTQGLCGACDRKLVATQLPDDRRWTTIDRGLPLLAWGLYDGALKRAIATLKYDGQTKLATALGHGLGRM
ncbi:MAG TPA: ComF family protein, partial [Coleofasciculaceae cyanobacterium]